MTRPRSYRLRPYVVTAMQVPDEGSPDERMAAVADWCGGTVRPIEMTSMDGARTNVHGVQIRRTQAAYPGNWIVAEWDDYSMRYDYEVMSPDRFHAIYEEDV